MATIDIPFSEPVRLGSEGEMVDRAFAGLRVSGNGPFSRQCAALLEQELGAPKVVMTTSCTHALEMAAMLLNISPGDKVLVPSFTFVSTINAFVMRGAAPVFVDIRPDTLNMDEQLVEELIDEQTRAIVPVHYGGVSCALDRILKTAHEHGVPVVEDNAHGLFGRYQGKPLGSFGLMATYSFHESKNFTCGEGGALAINDPSLVERAEVLSEKGTNRTSFFRGEIDKYTWIDVGSSFLLADVLAAVLLPQLEGRRAILGRRLKIWEAYEAALSDWASQIGATLPVIPEGCEHPAHVFYMLMPDRETRDQFISHMRERGILSVFHYLPLNVSPMGEKLGGHAGMCPVTERVAAQIVRLPLFFNMTDDQVSKVIDCAREFRA